MKLLFKTTNPTKLKADILKLIDDEELKTWSVLVSESIKYLNHIQQWGDKAVVKIEVDTNGQLIVQVRKFKNVTEEIEDFEGYYLGRFCEIIFVNFPNNFTSIAKQN